jgi:hypothetical protein
MMCKNLNPPFPPLEVRVLEAFKSDERDSDLEEALEMCDTCHHTGSVDLAAA